jgi:sodium/hydrogen exchange regulatory cofactor NHE-RF2
VDPGSPAEQSGLREGDRIIEVNGTNIAQENHKQVVERIKAIANETRLLVIDPKATVTDDNQIVSTNNNVVDASKPTSPVKAKPVPPPTVEPKKMSDDKPHSATVTTHTTTVTQEKTEIDGNIVTAMSTVTVNGGDAKKPEENGNGVQKSDAKPLNLQMTAAELRAKLAAKKKFDPKNEAVDLRKKHEMIEKM